MEDALALALTSVFSLKQEVLILVVVEDALAQGTFAVESDVKGQVLILVVMEDALAHKEVWRYNGLKRRAS